MTLRIAIEMVWRFTQEGDARSMLVMLDFLNNGQQRGRLSLEIGQDRVRFVVGGGRIQAVVSPHVVPSANSAARTRGG